MILKGPNATGQFGNFGKSTYVIYAYDARLVLKDLQLDAGNGSSGLAGANGPDASQVPAAAGQPGGNAGPISPDVL